MQGFLAPVARPQFRSTRDVASYRVRLWSQRRGARLRVAQYGGIRCCSNRAQPCVGHRGSNADHRSEGRGGVVSSCWRRRHSSCESKALLFAFWGSDGCHIAACSLKAPLPSGRWLALSQGTRFAAAAAGDTVLGRLASAGPGSAVGFVDPLHPASAGSTKTVGGVPGAPYTNVMVFCVGGITQGERTDLEKWGEAGVARGASLASSASTRVVRSVGVGCTSVTTGEDVIEQLAVLGAEPT